MLWCFDVDRLISGTTAEAERPIDEGLAVGRELLQVGDVERGERQPLLLDTRGHVERNRPADGHWLARFANVVGPNQALNRGMDATPAEVLTQLKLIAGIIYELRGEDAGLDRRPVRRAFLPASTRMPRAFLWRWRNGSHGPAT